MKNGIRIALVVVVALVALGAAAYRLWLYNPYTDEPTLDPEAIFGSGEPNVVLIRDVTLVDVAAGETVPRAYVLIQGDSIAAVAIDAAPKTPVGATVIEGGGRYLMPGLFDVHVHLGMRPEQIAGTFGPRDAMTTRVALEQFVRYGVTTVLAFGGGGSNDEQAAELKRLERANALVAPLLFATGDVVTAPGSHPITTIMRLAADTDSARLHQAGVTVLDQRADPETIVAKKRRIGLDGVKIILESGPPPWHPNPHLSAETAIRIVDVGRRHGMPVYAHAETLDDVRDAVRAGVDGVMHGVRDTLVRDTGLVAHIKEKGIFYVPTLSVYYGFEYLEAPERLDDPWLQAGVSRRTLRALANPLFQFGFGQVLGPYDVSAWLDTSMRNLKTLHEAGVRVALGTDASTPFVFPGYAAHIEMELMVRAGLSNADVLRIATLDSADFLDIADRVGTIEPGKLANLLLLDADPLADIRHTRRIEQVILKGRLVGPVPR